MTSNNLISPMKFCYNTNSTLPKQCQSSRSVLQDGSRTFGLFWKEKPRLITEEIRYTCLPYYFDEFISSVRGFCWMLTFYCLLHRIRISKHRDPVQTPHIFPNPFSDLKWINRYWKGYKYLGNRES